LVRQPKTAVLGWNQSTNISYPGSQSVKVLLLLHFSKQQKKHTLLYYGSFHMFLLLK